MAARTTKTKKAENQINGQPEEQKKQTLVSSKDLAILFGLTERRIQQLTSDGTITPVIETVGGKRVRRYDLLPTVHDYVTVLQDKAAGRERKKDAEEKEAERVQAEIDYKKAKARIVELELDEIEGRIYLAENVERVVVDMLTKMKSKLLAIPSQTAPRLEGKKKAKIEKILEVEVDKALMELSEYNAEDFRSENSTAVVENEADG